MVFAFSLKPVGKKKVAKKIIASDSTKKGSRFLPTGFHPQKCFYSKCKEIGLKENFIRFGERKLFYCEKHWWEARNIMSHPTGYPTSFHGR